MSKGRTTCYRSNPTTWYARLLALAKRAGVRLDCGSGYLVVDFAFQVAVESLLVRESHTEGNAF